MIWQTLQSLLTQFEANTKTGPIFLLLAFVAWGIVWSWVFRRGVNLLLDYDKDQRIDRMTASFISKAGVVFLWAFVIMLYAHTVPALHKMGTALLTSVSIASIVIGLATQSTLSNLVSGISLIFYRPFKLGDQIQINVPTGLEVGVIEDVSLGYTTLRTFDNRRVIISNSAISNAVMVNLTAVDPRIMAIIPFSISYDTDIEQARAIVMRLAEEHLNVEDVVGCPVLLLNTSSVDLSLRVWCKDSSTAAGVKYDLTEAIKKQFDREGVEIPFAYQNVIVKTVT